MLTAYHTSQLKEVTDVIAAAVPVEKIFLLAVQTTYSHYEHIFFVKDQPLQEVKHYHLLVLLTNAAGRSNDGWQEMIEARCCRLTPVTVRVLSFGTFHQWLQAGQPFACNVFSNGLLCYNAGSMHLAAPRIINNPDLIEKSRLECRHYMLRSEEFLAGATLYSLRREYKLAAFLLHQAAEQAYVAINWQVTGYRPNTHSIDRLHRLALPFSKTLAAIFPRNNETEERLFRLLQKAYIDTRYTCDYCIDETDLQRIAGKIKELHAVAKRLCMEPVDLAQTG